MDSALRSSTSSDDPCERFSLPTSATSSSISDDHINEQKFNKMTASIDNQDLDPAWKVTVEITGKYEILLITKVS
uniref:C2 domain-containing protein n=1 Tax=Ascaris lumbricoides TaxID=6252 RepID=A0A0M3HGG5_ASCLU